MKSIMMAGAFLLALAGAANAQTWLTYSHVATNTGDYRAVAACIFERTQANREWGSIANIAVLDATSRAYVNLSTGGAMNYEIRVQQSGDQVSIDMFAHQSRFQTMARAAISQCVSA